jgi:hypothetical protein
VFEHRQYFNGNRAQQCFLFVTTAVEDVPNILSFGKRNASPIQQPGSSRTFTAANHPNSSPLIQANFYDDRQPLTHTNPVRAHRTRRSVSSTCTRGRDVDMSEAAIMIVGGIDRSATKILVSMSVRVRVRAENRWEWDGRRRSRRGRGAQNANRGRVVMQHIYACNMQRERGKRRREETNPTCPGHHRTMTTAVRSTRKQPRRTGTCDPMKHTHRRARASVPVSQQMTQHRPVPPSSFAAREFFLRCPCVPSPALRERKAENQHPSPTTYMRAGSAFEIDGSQHADTRMEQH